MIDLAEWDALLAIARSERAAEELRRWLAVKAHAHQEEATQRATCPNLTAGEDPCEAQALMGEWVARAKEIALG